jgi:cytochrome c biogenesis protein CcmG/thiol:disulfide interchange protein DsbE
MSEDTGTKTTTNSTTDRTRAPKLIGLVILGALFLAACTSAVADQAPAGDAGASALPADFQITVYQGEDVLGGQGVNLSDVLAEGKPIVLNFWAGLCPPCRLEMPDLQGVHDAFKDDIVLFGLDVGPFTALGTNDDGKQLLGSLGVTYPTGTTSDAKVVQAYQITGMPSTYFIKPNGEIARKWTGLLTEEKLTELVQELLDASGSS